MSVYIAPDKWASLVPFLQLAHGTSFSGAEYETLLLLTFRRHARLPTDIEFGVAHEGRGIGTNEF